ncbi:MAG TPA: TIGR00730 family Rossman fold protein, partial [Candidatus Binatia bacterium]|nr:TIGR00730 family Rossman fold protein [Candidatus Binatia bacterium]
ENHDVDELYVVKSMHERKKLMSEKADAAIVMPGGFGMLDELFEFLTWTQLGIQHKPCGLLNVNNYFRFLLEHLDLSVREGFIRADHRHILAVYDEPYKLIRNLAGWTPTHAAFGQYSLS